MQWGGCFVLIRARSRSGLGAIHALEDRVRRNPGAQIERSTMKGKHPDLVATHVRCSACGNEFTTRSVREELVLEVCANCHPAYTGIERPIAPGSRIERFERRRRAALAA